MRPLWKGGISFGLIYIPVKMYTATKDNRLEFHLVDTKSLDPIGYVKINKRTGKPVPNERIAKAYEYAKGKMVVMEDEDFDKADVERSSTIDIISFADISEIDPKYFEKAFYLEPEDNADKTYALLAKALGKEKKVGVAKFVLKTREHLALVRAEGEYLILQQLRFAAEVLAAEDLELEVSKKRVAKEELELAQDIIKKLSKPFKPEQIRDTYVDSLKKVIRYKAAHKQIKTKGKKPEATKVTDIMAQLKKSLEAMPA